MNERNGKMVNIYDYTNQQLTILETHDTWSIAEYALNKLKQENIERPLFIAGKVNGRHKIDNKDCPINITDLIKLGIWD